MRLELKEKQLPGRWVYEIQDEQQQEAWTNLTGFKHITHERLEQLRTLGVKPDIESTPEDTRPEWRPEAGKT